LLIGAFQVKNL